MQHFQTGGLGDTVRHPGHHDHRISPPLTSFYGGMLRTKCFRHQFQILQIWKARITDAFATITEHMLESMRREIDCRLDVLRANKSSTCWSVLMCCKKTSWVTFWREKTCLYSRYSSFLVINVYNQGKVLCSPVHSFCVESAQTCVFKTQKFSVWPPHFTAISTDIILSAAEICSN